MFVYEVYLGVKVTWIWINKLNKKKNSLCIRQKRSFKWKSQCQFHYHEIGYTKHYSVRTRQFLLLFICSTFLQTFYLSLSSYSNPEISRFHAQIFLFIFLPCGSGYLLYRTSPIRKHTPQMSTRVMRICWILSADTNQLVHSTTGYVKWFLIQFV